MAEILVTLSDGRQMRHRLSHTPEIAGRDHSCEIHIDDPSTSRRHARFVPTSSGYLVEDLGSKNGTLINDRACASHVVHHGDRILLGSVVLEFLDDQESQLPSVVVDDDQTTISRATRFVSADRELVLSRQRLQVIYELSERLTTLRGFDALLEDAARVSMDMLKFERCAIGLRHRERRSVDWPVVHNLRGAQGELTISGSLLRRALEHGERAIFSGDVGEGFDPTVSIVQHGIRSAMCVPLMHGGEILGVIYGDRITASAAYTQEDIDFLAAIARQVSIGVVNARLLDEQRRLTRMEHDLQLARRIQTGLFPSTLPALDQLTVAALNEPGNRVSGDYYDVLPIDDACCWLIIADVTGEGVPAALLMANLQAAVRVTLAPGLDPGALLERWNRLIYANTGPETFITCLLMDIDAGRHTLRLASAGHSHPLILTDGCDGPLAMEDPTGFPLGVVEDAEYRTTELGPLGVPTKLLTFTDGVVEAMNEEKTCYGAERLHQTMFEHRDKSPQRLVQQVRRDVAAFAGLAPQSDDITILAAEMK